ncbi:sterol desaturase family protein [Mucilaginibacter sp.]|uniref:sterol desaturase family protein n=1 Tax=Mucilaginibacter sp. TaxID=1882438 RepID=UPI0035BC7134
MNPVANFFITVLAVTILRYFIIAGAAFFTFYKSFSSKAVSLKIQSKNASKADFIRDIFHSMQTAVIFGVIACIIFLTPVRQITQIPPDGTTMPLWWIALSLPLSLIIHDTYFYWMHRLLHHPRLFKHSHVLHHRSTNPSPWSSYSFHFFEAFTEGLILLIVTILLPMNALAIGLFILVGFVINVYGHLGFEVAPLWLRNTPLFEIINTSVHHNVHHSKFKGNYGLYFRIWDRLMGTEHPDYVREYDRIQANRMLALKHKKAQSELQEI